MLRWKSSLKPAAAAATGITLETSAATITSGSSSQNPDVNIPAVSVDDILIFYCATYNNADPTSSPPSGWTKIIEQDSASVYGSTVAAYWKRAAGSAAATTETWTGLYPNNESAYIWVGAYSGCLTSGSPIDVSVGSGWSSGSSRSNSFTTTVDNAMVVSMAGVYNHSTTWSPDGEIVDLEFQDNINSWASVNGTIEATAGSKTVTASFSGSTRSAIVTVALKPAGGGYLIDEDFEDNVLPSDWTFTGNSYTVAGGKLYGVNGSDYVTFDVPAAMQDEFWMKALFRYGGTFSKANYNSLFEILDSGGSEFIKGTFYGKTTGFYQLDGATTTTSLKPSAKDTDYYLWFHFVKNGTSEMFLSTSSTRPTTDSSTEVAITCSTDNTSADKFKLKLGWSNGTRPTTWDFFIGNDTDPDA